MRVNQSFRMVSLIFVAFLNSPHGIAAPACVVVFIDGKASATCSSSTDAPPGPVVPSLSGNPVNAYVPWVGLNAPPAPTGPSGPGFSGTTTFSTPFGGGASTGAGSTINSAYVPLLISLPQFNLPALPELPAYRPVPMPWESMPHPLTSARAEMDAVRSQAEAYGYAAQNHVRQYSDRLTKASAEKYKSAFESFEANLNASLQATDLQLVAAPNIWIPAYAPATRKRPSREYVATAPPGKARDNIETILVRLSGAARVSGAQAIAADAAFEAALAADQLLVAQKAAAAEAYLDVGLAMTDVAVGFIPVVGWARDTFESIAGLSVLTGKPLDSVGRTLAIVSVATAGVSAGPSRLERLAPVLKKLQKLLRTGDEAQFAKSFGEATQLLKDTKVVGHFHPINLGPLSERWADANKTIRIADTFRGGTYYELRSSGHRDFYRSFSLESGMFGSYWSTVRPTGPTQAVVDLALNPGWVPSNAAMSWVHIRLPPGHTFYLGATAMVEDSAKGVYLLGGGRQVVIPGPIDPKWRISNGTF